MNTKTHLSAKKWLAILVGGFLVFCVVVAAASPSKSTPTAAAPVTAKTTAAAPAVQAAAASSEVSETAKTAAEQGRPCEAAELPGQAATYTEACTAQKNQAAAAKEANAENEEIREGERLKAEGK